MWKRRKINKKEAGIGPFFKNLLLTGVVNISMRAKTAVVELMDATALGIAENERLASLPSARRISRFPESGQMMWSTLERTFSQRISGDLKLESRAHGIDVSHIRELRL